MSSRRPTMAAILVLALASYGPAAPGQPAPAPVAAVPDGASAEWNAMLDHLRDLPSRVLAKLPEDERSDPLIQQEAAQLALGAMTSAGIAALGGDIEHPMFLPLSGPLFGIGQPNADTVYKTAHVDPAGTYRLRGTPGTLRMAIIAQHGAIPGDPVAGAPGQPGRSRGQLDLASLARDGEGRFDLLISPTRPAGHTGDWWKLEPGTAKLMVRQVSADWAGEIDPALSIERLDVPARRGRPSEGALRDKLRRYAAMADFIAPMLAGDPARVKGQGEVNRMVEHTVDRGMLAGQFYYTAYYDLADDEALILETQMPETCRYWSIILTNHLYVTTDWYNNQSSLNDAQARADADGMLRVVISRHDPGVANWIDTAGYPRGLIQGRWTECSGRPLPALRKVPVAQVGAALPAATPAVTPQQREQIIRERRAALSQRRLW